MIALSAQAAPKNGLCEFWRKERLVEKKICVLDHCNSGLVQIITNHGTLSFQLRDSRLDQYSLDGQIYQHKGNVFDGGTFFLVSDPSTSISWLPIR
jgi:hypothetical protein